MSAKICIYRDENRMPRAKSDKYEKRPENLNFPVFFVYADNRFTEQYFL